MLTLDTEMDCFRKQLSEIEYSYKQNRISLDDYIDKLNEIDDRIDETLCEYGID